MKSLYISRCDDLLTVNSPDVKKWGDIYKLTSLGVNLIDRCGNVKMPFNFKLYEPFVMPRDLSNFNLTYEECCEKRANELIDLSRRINKPITIFYSGGIDSTGVLVSFMKVLDPQELKERIRVALSVESIQENLNFYYKFIRPRCTIVSSEYMSSMIDGSSIIVGGEHNDQIFGSDIIGRIYRFGNFEKINEPYSRDFVSKWFTRSMPEESANKWFDLITDQFKKDPICDVRTNFDFFWWYNFCFKWQNIFFRMLITIDADKRQNLNDEFIKNHYHQFYSSEDFQKWSMLNPHLKINKEWNSYKMECKKMIYNYNRDEKYRDFKIKTGSLYRLFLQKKTATAITDQYEFLDSVNPVEFYNPDNSFQ